MLLKFKKQFKIHIKNMLPTLKLREKKNKKKTQTKRNEQKGKSKSINEKTTTEQQTCS